MHNYTNIIGSFVFDDKTIKESNVKNSDKLEQFSIRKLLTHLRDRKYLKLFREANLNLAKSKIKESVNKDNFICQAINSISETDKVINLLSKRLREWYSLYNPEFEHSISNNERFSELIRSKSKSDLLSELSLNASMGADLDKSDIDPILILADQIQELVKYRKNTIVYLDKIMELYCPNLKEMAGTTIGAKLIEHTGSLKRLAFMPASTVQILGAEKALFRHLKTGAKPPKYGLILEHSFIKNAKRNEQGKRARALADKISVSIKMDFFKGEFIAPKLKEELENKFK
jgi:nucleolar protein 56